MRTGRPREGNARRVTLSVKVTERERDELVGRFGSAYVGLRRAVDAILQNPVRTEPTASVEGTRGAIIDEATEEMTDIAVNIPKQNIVIVDSLGYPADRGKKERHVHKPASLVSSEHVRGDLMETWACECGHVLPARKAK